MGGLYRPDIGFSLPSDKMIAPAAGCLFPSLSNLASKIVSSKIQHADIDVLLMKEGFALLWPGPSMD